VKPGPRPAVRKDGGPAAAPGGGTGRIWSAVKAIKVVDDHRAVHPQKAGPIDLTAFSQYGAFPFFL